jgi:hypothetical protein
MKIRIIICLFTVYCNPTFSQTFGGTDQTIAPIYYNLSTIEGNKKYSQDFFKNIEGSPYLFKNFVLSEIVGVNTKMMLRYNAYDDVIEVQKAPDEIYTVSKDPLYNTFLMNYNQFKLRLVSLESDSNEPSNLYLFELLSTNNLSLLRRDKIDFIEGRIPKTSFDLGNKPKFTSVKYSYYLETKDKKIVAFPDSKAKLLLIYPQQESEIKKYIKDNSISLSKEKDLIILTQFLSTL